MKPIHWLLVGLVAIAAIVTFTSCGGGPDTDRSAPLAEYTYKCGACKHECKFTRNDISKLKNKGKAVAEPGSMLKLECPSCQAIEASPYEPYNF